MIILLFPTIHFTTTVAATSSCVLLRVVAVLHTILLSCLLLFQSLTINSAFAAAVVDSIVRLLFPSSIFLPC